MRTFYKPALVLLAALLIAVSSGFQSALNTQRRDPALGLSQSSGLENAPPLLAFTTVALGGFRGIIANVLWIRATRLQDEGKFFEMVQLSDWITKLEPHFAQVWVNRAWNMAYNISVRFTSPTDRWRWVKAGVELLRDDGLRYNPKDAQIYRELGWLFQHKMGYFLDEAHLYYKGAWFAEMTAAMGAGATNLSLLVNPPDDAYRQRAKALKENYKLDPVIMAEVEAKYGQIEWRLPETHAIYWGHLGLKNCPDDRKNHENLITLRRLIYQSLHALVLRGRIVNFTSDGLPQTSPRFDLIEITDRTFEELKAEEKTARGYSIMVAQRNFMREVIFQLYAANRKADAEKWFKRVRDNYPEFTDGETSMEPYALKRLENLIQEGNYQRTKPVIIGFLQSEIYAEAEERYDEALQFAVIASYVYDRFTAKYGDSERIRLPPMTEIRREVLCDLLHPELGLYPSMAAKVMTRRKVTSYTNLCDRVFTLPTTNMIFETTKRVEGLKIDAPQVTPTLPKK